jgi:ESF2/ABP1 family protein
MIRVNFTIKKVGVNFYFLLVMDTENGSSKTTSPGVVYMSRIPPKLTPSLIRSMLEQYGGIGQIYLVPRDKNFKLAKTGDGKGLRAEGKGGFTEGWIEFEDKRVAKRVAETLNCTSMGTRKRDAFFDELWNLKYLTKFKWHHLTDQLAYEKRVKSRKLRTELDQAKRIAEHYHSQVEKARKSKSARSVAADSEQTKPVKTFKRSRSFYKQRQPVTSKE